MSDKTVRELAEMVNIPLDRFLEQLQEAGIRKQGADDLIDEDERVKLLTHLRQRHGKTDSTADEAPKKITLKRRKVTELKQTSGTGSAKTVNVEVRKKKTYIKKDEARLTEDELEIEKARKALEEQRRQIAEEEADRK